MRGGGERKGKGRSDIVECDRGREGVRQDRARQVRTRGKVSQGK
jgi:hypothetical protein